MKTMETHEKTSETECNYILKFKGAMSNNWGKERVYRKRCWGNLLPTRKKMKLNPYLTLYVRIKYKQTSINVKRQIRNIILNVF